MIVTIKFIAGQECDLEVESDYTISSVKQLVSEHFDVPVEHQRLVFKGKILADASCLCDYNIIAGTKLHLTVKKPEGGGSQVDEEKARGKLLAQLRTLLRPHYTETDLEKVVDQFSKDLDRQIGDSSLDDIERVAHSQDSPVQTSSEPLPGPSSSKSAPGYLSKAGQGPVKSSKKT